MIVLTEKEFKQLTGYIQTNYGINLTEKKLLVETRLYNVLVELGFDNFSDYFDYLFSDPTGEAVIVLLNKLTTNHTHFLREAEHLYFFRDQVLPYLASKVTDRDLRIWSAGCSTGEEPFTLAMVIADFFGFQKDMWDTKILATDISQKVLTVASKGIYDEEQIASIPDHWKRCYFKKTADGKFEVDAQIKNQVIFRRFNLMTPEYPFKKKFHVIFCKNVMIYFDTQAKTELIHKLWESTEAGGYLFVGLSESLNHEHTGYKYLRPAIYRKE